MYQPSDQSFQGKALRDQGIAALQQGDRQRARELLSQATQLNPADEYAWLWLSSAVDNDWERRQCLERVLAINPSNEAARRELQNLPPIPAQPPFHQHQTPPPQTLPAFYTPGGPLPAAANAPQPGGYAQPGYPPSSLYVPTARAGRPGCITALAVLFFAGGLILIGILLIVMATSHLPEFRQGFAEGLGGRDDLVALFLVIFMLLGLFALATGVGLWRGTRWGWWLAATYYAFAVTRAILGMTIAASRNTLGDDLSSLLGDILGETLVALLIYLYLFKPRIWSFFGLEQTSKGVAAAVTLVIGFILSVMLYAALLI